MRHCKVTVAPFHIEVGSWEDHRSGISSVPPLCSLCLSGECSSQESHHRGTEVTEDAQSLAKLKLLIASKKAGHQR